MNRRDIICAAPAVLIAGAGGADIAAAPADPYRAIQHHIAEAVRLLRETAPEGFEVMEIYWLNCRGPEAPDDLICQARGDEAQDYGRAMFRPRYRSEWSILKPPRILG